MTTDAPLLSAPPETPGPLWVRGRRRPGRSQWGYDPAEPPELEPPPAFRRNGAHPCRRAVEHWTAGGNYRERARIHPELRKRRGRDARKWKRGDWSRWHHRFAVFLAEHADVRTQEVTKLGPDGDRRFMNLKEIAERVGCPFTEADARRASGAPVRVERLIADFVDAGLAYRRELGAEDADGNWTPWAAVLKVTELFWEVSGAMGARRAYLERVKRHEARAARDAAERARTDAEYQSDEQARARRQRSWHEAQAEDRAEAKRAAAAARRPPPPDGDPPPT